MPTPANCNHPGDNRPASVLLRGNGLDRVPGTRAWHQLTVSALSLLIVMSLALSWAGPMLDHHFAERHPAHQHIYLGTATSEHSHDYGAIHIHSVTSMMQLSTGQPSGGLDDGIVFVVPIGGSGQGVADLAAPMISESPRFGIGDGTGILGHHFGSDSILPGTSIAPPVRPPRA